MNVSTHFVMVILEAKSNPVIMELWGSLRPQQPARTARGRGRHPAAEPGTGTRRTVFRF